MTDTPSLTVVVGPNGAGKTTLASEIVAENDGVEFVNADIIAAELWPGEEEARSYEAAQLAAERRTVLLESRTSFVTETVFSHPSKVELIHSALEKGFAVHLHVVMVPEDLAVARVGTRVAVGGHSVPEEKIRTRHRRLWGLVAEVVPLCERARFYDNTSADPEFRLVAEFTFGRPLVTPSWPPWTPRAVVGRLGI